MNSLPRFLGLALFVVLVGLTVLVGTAVWIQPAGRTAAGPDVVNPASTNTSATTPGAPAPQRFLAVSRRAAAVLAVLSLVLSGALLVSLSLQPPVSSSTPPPFPAARQEINTIAKLAENSAAQGEELARERDVRRRAEEDSQLRQELLAQSVDEKIRLGRDLHDGIIQSLYAVGLTIESARALLKSDPEEAERRLDAIRANLNGTIRDVRGYIAGLAPENLRRASFSRSVSTFFDQLRASRSAAIEINIDETAAALLSVEQHVEALQIAREAISNALRHGQASQIMLRMHQGDGAVGLLIQDNGRGFSPQLAHGGGHGLSNMRARAERLGASLRVSSEPGQGTRVVANFPIHEKIPV